MKNETVNFFAYFTIRLQNGTKSRGCSKKYSRLIQVKIARFQTILETTVRQYMESHVQESTYYFRVRFILGIVCWEASKW